MSEAKPNADAEAAGNTETAAQPLAPAEPSLAALVFNWKTLAASLLCFAVWIGWVWRDNIIDRLASVDGMQDRIAITVASPTVHTRERLLNDRFEQVSWLDRELDLTNPPKASGPTPDPVAAATKAGSETPMDQNSFAAGPLSATSRLNSQLRYGAGDPRQLFEMMNGFRDVLRAERARAMLDDRHDVDNSTLDLFSFDATVMPRDNARGYAAVEVVLTREPGDLWENSEGRDAALKRHEEQTNTDLFDTYVGWLEKVRELQQIKFLSLTQALDRVELASDRSDYETTLRVAVCSKYLLMRSGHGDSEDVRRQACRKATLGATLYGRDKNGQGESASEVPRALAREAEGVMAEIDNALSRLTQQLNVSQPDSFRKATWPQVSNQLQPAVWSLVQQQRASRQEEKQRAKALQDAAGNIDAVMKSADDIAFECLNGSPDTPIGEVDVISPKFAQAAASTPFAQSQSIPKFHCFQIPRNASWRVLFNMSSRLDEAAKDGRALDFKAMDTVPPVSTNCLAAMLLEESLVRPTAEQPRNHGAALQDFFDIKVERVASGCSVSVQPKINTLRLPDKMENAPCDMKKLETPHSSKILCRLNQVLEGPGYGDQPLEQPATRAYGYSLSPRLRQNVEVKASQNDTAGIGSASAGFGLGSTHSLEYRGVEPEVVGFARPIPSVAERRILGARFGWLISPRPGREMTWSVPLEQAQLSAVVALPSWWRSALLQVCSRFVPYKALADVVTDKFWQRGRQCRVEMIRLPGSAADISRRLGMDVLTTPYMDQWSPGPPVLYAGNTGEPTHLLITGERLWRNTVVTLDGQKADRIEVLPDMVGITATFDCVHKPTSERTRSNWTPSQRAESKPATKSSTGDHLPATASRTGAGVTSMEAAPPPPDPLYTAYIVPVIVWTSEGHTHSQDATVVVRTDNTFRSCPAPGGRILGSPDLAPLTSHPATPLLTTENPQTTVQTDRR